MRFVKKYFLLLLFCLSAFTEAGYGQGAYSSYFTGNANDIQAQARGGVCLMGGATESDDAMKWFLKRAGGGDVLVLRASGSDGYNDYFYSQLGVLVNSVETIVFNQKSAAQEPYIHDKIKKAEAIWLAGGDQWKYVDYWRNSTIDSLINEAIGTRNVVIGGTSAGMAILGRYYFSAKLGTVTSDQALSDPYNAKVIADSNAFLKVLFMGNVITDTHYDNPDRRGRHLVLLARIFQDYGVAARGIACDEYTAVCVDTAGIARAFGAFPGEDDNAYFIQLNCGLGEMGPEQCTPGASGFLWEREGKALLVYQVKGTKTGAQGFDLKNWKTGFGGVWKYWYVGEQGLNTASGMEPECLTGIDNAMTTGGNIRIFPNPVDNRFNVYSSVEYIQNIKVFDLSGTLLIKIEGINSPDTTLDLDKYSAGLYHVRVETAQGSWVTLAVKIQ